VGSNLTQSIDVLCAFFYVCVQVEALRRADHPPRESYRKSKICVNRSEMESFMDVGPNEACSAKGKKNSFN
jgi:hypothetical protein